MTTEVYGGTLGIVGGGQLGRMMTQAAKRLGIGVVVLESGENCPAAQVGARQIVGSLNDPEALGRLAEQSSAVTWEIEHIGAAALQELEWKGVAVRPSPQSLALIKDKFLQKTDLFGRKIPVADFEQVDEASYASVLERLGPMIVKTRRGGYDGRGNLVVRGQTWREVKDHFGPDAELYAERIVPFVGELAVTVVRDVLGDVVTYPVVETVHRNNICHVVRAPAPVDAGVADAAQAIVLDTVAGYRGAGVFTVELFRLPNDRLLVNEVAPRVHNSAHWTIEGTKTSQFENAVRAAMALPLGSTAMTVPFAVMVNVLGTAEHTGKYPEGAEDAAQEPGVGVHLYGKTSRHERKVGHVTAVGDSLAETEARAHRARSLIRA